MQSCQGNLLQGGNTVPKEFPTKALENLDKSQKFFQESTPEQIRIFKLGQSTSKNYQVENKSDLTTKSRITQTSQINPFCVNDNNNTKINNTTTAKNNNNNYNNNNSLEISCSKFQE